MMQVLFVALGGAIGSVLRYLASVWAAQRWGAEFPYGTLLVNVVGCYLIGLSMIVITERLDLHPYWRLLIVSGFLGGLTTFSSFSYETLRLFEEGLVPPLLNIATNLGLGLTATVLGLWTGRAL
jgi:fluoride exporter